MVKELSKLEISEMIKKDENFNTILKVYKNNKYTKGNLIEYKNDYKNGLTYNTVTIDLNDTLNTVIVPIFSTEKTITWNYNYLNFIKNSISFDGDDQDLINKIVCPLYYFDKYNNEMIFLQLIKLTDFIANGAKGRNGQSVYFWNDKLPNQYAIKKKDIVSKLFVDTLPVYNKKELKEICLDYANKYYTKFNSNDTRTAKTVITNIANGLYAQLTVYLQLLKDGYDVSMNWYNEDDLGIDIQFNINNEVINIDVKSTKNNDLKISKNRKETDFYAICTWEKSQPLLLGYVFKYYFWKSKILNTDKPNSKDDMFFKSIKELEDYIIPIDDLFKTKHKYKTLKMKRGKTLFNID
jgi:hypothetical protein